jgi:hypothetical protein
MKLEIGKRYTISDKIKNAFGVKSSEAKVVSISNSIVMLEIDGMAFPLKEAIALTNLYNSYQLTAQMTEEKEKKYEDSIPETVEDDVPVVTPEPEEIEGDDISTPVVESDPKKALMRGWMTQSPRRIINRQRRLQRKQMILQKKVWKIQ